MAHNGDGRADARLFQFAAPGLPDLALAVALQEVLEVAELPHLTPIPFAPSFLLGISERRGSLVTVVDMAGILSSHAPPRSLPSSDLRCLVAQVVVGTQLDVMAWPILPGAAVLSAPGQAARAGVLPALLAQGVYAAISLEERSCVLLNLGGIADYVAASSVGVLPLACSGRSIET